MLNERIKSIRLAKGLSQVELARTLGVTKQSISNWENDNIQPSIEMLIKIATYFSVTTDYLLGLESRQYIEVSGLSETEISHIRQIVSDISKNKPR